MDIIQGDRWLERRLAQYDGWTRERRIPSSSKVIPINRSLSALQWVLPNEQLLEILRNSRTFALTRCSCRTRYGRCDNPLEVCFLINDVAEAHIEKGLAREVSLARAEEAAQLAEAHGLVHLTIYNPEQHVYAVCSCCECCCHDLQFLKKYGRQELIAKSQYIAETNLDACTHCGMCVEHCVFDARTMSDTMQFNPNLCWGCGVCITACPEEAITLKLKTSA
jgi:ferredoxin